MAAAIEIMPLRFHLMIGASGSGKSTAARLLACRLRQGSQQGLRYISSNQIRRELYGSHRHLGSWAEVEMVIHRQLLAAIAARETVILDATYVRRDYRLAITQALPLPEPVQWIGWWLDTPLQQCLAWNQQADDPVPEEVIQRQCAHLLQSAPVPHRQEGFAAVVRLQPAQGLALEQLITAALEQLESCVRRGANRDAAYCLHGFSRLLDLERLLYLIRLLSRYPQLTATNSAAAVAGDDELSQLLSPLPMGGLEQQAAALLGRLHGACYRDAAAVAANLRWLDHNGFSARWLTRPEVELPAIEPPPWSSGRSRPTGGLPRLADRAFFERVFAVLRHLLRHPHDLQSGERVAEHLARSLESSTDQPWTARQVHAALHQTLTPYGFRLPHRSGRQGYGLGAALLSLPELRDTAELLQLQAEHLGDRRAAAISTILHNRLAAIKGAASGPPLRRWLQPTPPPSTSARSGSGSIAAAGASGQMQLMEAAIAQRQRLFLSHARHGEGQGSRAEPVWPLQLLLHAGRWWLLIEHDTIGQPQGLLRCLEVGAVHVFQREQRRGRSVERHREAIERARLLERCCGGLCFGENLQAQLALSHPQEGGNHRELVVLRFRCSPGVMADVRRDLDRFDPAAVRLAAALPTDSWGRPERGSRGLHVGDDPRHPYPVEVDLPSWIVAGDGELRRWLFSYGPAIRLESPDQLVAEHTGWLRATLQGYAPRTRKGVVVSVTSESSVRQGTARRVVRKRQAVVRKQSRETQPG